MTGPSFDPGFSTPEVTAALSPAARVAAMCRVEAALARAEADVGVVPDDAARAIEAVCDAGVDDPTALLAAGWDRGTPVLELLDRLRSALDEDAARWLHHGATSQDVLDTATVLLLREGLRLVRADLAQVATRLRDLSIQHRATGTDAWTFLQRGVPTTVGRRCAGWLAPAVDDLASLRRAATSLPVQLGGPTGTLDVLDEDADAVVAALADRLDLAVPVAPWHTDRGPVVRPVQALQSAARTIATIGTDLALLAHDGLATMRAGGSSSMPGKRNPIDAVRAIAAAEACAGVASIVTGGRPHELERAVGGWHAEWFAVPLVVHTAAAAAAAARAAVGSLELRGSGDDGTGRTPSTDGVVYRVVAACEDELAR